MSPAELSLRVWDAPRPELPVLALTTLPFEGEHVAPLGALPLRLHAGARLRALRLLETARAGGARAPIQLLGALEDHEAAAVLADEPHLFSATADDAGALERLAVRLGLAIVPGLSAYALRHPRAAASILERVSSPRIAPAFALLLEHPACADSAEQWMIADPLRAAIGLWPVALGPDETMRSPAARALRLLAWLGRGDALRGAAGRYGVHEHVEALLADDRPHRPPPLAVPLEGLPVLRDRAGEPLAPTEVHVLLELLRATPRRPPCSALGRVRASLLARDLDRFVLALFDRFFAVGEREPDRWMMHAASVVGGDVAVLGLLERLPKLASITPEHARVVLDSLASIATPLAVLELESLARRGGVAGLRDGLGRAIVESRVRSGKPPFGVGPEHVPDLFEGRRELVSSAGDGELRARLSSGFEVILCDARGHRVTLEEPSSDATCDPVSQDARERARALARAAELASELLLERFELAMTRRRAFSAEVFAGLCRSATHAPLVSSLLFRLEPCGVLVRLAEDGALEDVEERPVALEGNESIELADPGCLSATERQRWSSRFEDYEIIQPFPQLERCLCTRAA